MIKKFLYIFLLVLTVKAFGADNAVNPLNYKFEEYTNKEKAEYKFNKFYPIHYFYLDIFLDLDLTGSLTYEQKKDIIVKLINVISNNNFGVLTVSGYKDNNDLVITVKPLQSKKTGENAILLYSNFDFKKNKIVSGDDMKDAYATYYIIKGDKLINYNYVYTKKREQELFKENNINNIADYYIYDDNAENDSNAEEMLNKFINETADINKKFICSLTLTEYYFTKNDLAKVKQIIDEIKLLIPELNKEIKESFTLIYDITVDLYNMMNEIN